VDARKAGFAIPGGGGLALAAIFIAKALSHSAAVIHDLNPIRYSVAHITPHVEEFVQKGDANEVFINALCTVVTSDLNQRPPGESVGGFVTSQISEQTVGYSLLLPQEKLDQFEAALQLSQWDSGVAAKYIQVCGRTGFPR
jgi:hypothetical protein